MEKLGLKLREFWDDASLRLGQLFALAAVALLALIALALAFKSLPALESGGIGAFLADEWKPARGLFGIMPYVFGTLATTAIALAIATPLCLLAAIYLSEYADGRTRRSAGLFIDVLAGVPSVVFGMWGVIFAVPLVRDFLGPVFGAKTSGFSILAGGMVLALMVAPIIVSLSVEVLRAVPYSLREASMALGATKAQTLRRVVLRKGANGIVAAVVLGFSRAIGETMAVMMVVGNVAAYPKGVFEPAYPLTALIANNYGEMMSVPLYDSALMAAALVLFAVVIAFNLIARAVLRQMQGASDGGPNASKAIRMK